METMSEDLPIPIPAPVVDLPLAPPPGLVEVGAAWSNCEYRSTSAVHHHEWATELIPAEYRQINLAANLGHVAVKFLSCSGIAIGNQTFLPHVHWGYFGVLVDPPQGAEAPWASVYLLDFLTDNPMLAQEMVKTGAPTRIASFSLAEGSYHIMGNGTESAFELAVSDLHVDQAPANSTDQVRLHWRDSSLRCWTDLQKVYEKTADTKLQFEGKAGRPETVSGPARTLAGLGTHGTESGQLAAPTCIGVE